MEAEALQRIPTQLCVLQQLFRQAPRGWVTYVMCFVTQPRSPVICFGKCAALKIVLKHNA